MIWRESIDLEQLNNINEYMGTFLGIEFTDWTKNTLTATMPVETKTKQPFGVLHGGASVVLAETIGSIASNLIIDNSQQVAVGLEINANHIRSVKYGLVKGTASPIHIGRKTHVWEIKIVNEQEKMVCASRLTVAIVDK